MKIIIYIDFENESYKTLGDNPEEDVWEFMENCINKLEWFSYQQYQLHPTTDITIYGDVEK